MSTKDKAPVHFLLVDDLEENLLALEGLLRREGLVLLKARSGTEALECLLKHEVALALVDVQMPLMDGFELAELMRGTDRTRRVPIIFLTAGETDRRRRFQGYEAGAVDFLQKPVEPDILRSKAEVFFDLYRQRQEVAVQRDELKLATEENLRLLQESQLQAEALKEADQRKDDFLAMLAHELRNPLAPIKNAVEILRLAGPADGELSNAREIISRQVSHMARLIDDLLDVARIARGKVELRIQECDLVTIVRQTTADYSPSLAALGISLESKFAEGPLLLAGDPTRLAQVIGNLLHNAGKFTPRGGAVQVTVDKSSTAAAGTVGIVTIQDTGAGIDATVMRRLFEPFGQANQALDRTKGGLGLGLALAQGLVELHGGSISVESEGIGKGSTFKVQLPLGISNRADTRPAGSSGAQPVAEPLRILIVEDNRDAAQSMGLLLSILGHAVEVAFDAAAALEVVRANKPDVIFSDLGLPGGMDGFALARAIRRDPAVANTHLIALSGYGQDEDRRRSREAGFDRHLVKPIDLATLKQTLGQVTHLLHS